LPSIFDPAGGEPAADGVPPQSLQDRVHAVQAAEQRDASAEAAQSEELRAREGMANRLLASVVAQAMTIAKSRQHTKALEILRIHCGLPGGMFLRPIRVRTGRVLTLTKKHYDWNERDDRDWGPGIIGLGRNVWAISDDLELFTFNFTRVWFGEYGDPAGNVDISGPKITGLNSFDSKTRAVSTVAKKVRGSVEQAGCAAAISRLEPVRAFGAAPTKNFGYDTGTDYFDAFYLDESGTLMYGTPRVKQTAEDAMARALA
jgi:hypothetical protein